jgi:hypothetical protein
MAGDGNTMLFFSESDELNPSTFKVLKTLKVPETNGKKLEKRRVSMKTNVQVYE